MTPEEVARKHQFREGFCLVDYSEVGLPIFRLTIEAVYCVPDFTRHTRVCDALSVHWGESRGRYCAHAWS